MDKNRHILKDKAAKIIFISLFLLWIVGRIIVVYFYYDETHGRINKFVAENLVLVISIIIGSTALFMYNEWNRGKYSDNYSKLKPCLIKVAIIFVITYEAMILFLVFI